MLLVVPIADETSEAASDPGPPPVRTERRGDCLWVVLDRPDVGNAIDVAAIEALETILDAAESDRSLRSLVLVGSGGNFCAGADIAENGRRIATGAIDETATVLGRAADVTDRLAALPFPVIAAVDGVAFAGGFELVLAADIVVATTRARFADGHVAHGFVPGWGSTARAPEKLGAATAARLLIGGDTVTAAELPMLVAQVVEHDDLAPAVTAITDRISAAGPEAIAVVKELLRARPDRSHADSMAAERAALRAHLASAELAEGATAFREHRRPQFGPRSAR
jgi:enoyl-CoA hydratase/carnithine racemase